MNYFSPKSAAERYAKGRPFFHPLIIGRIRQLLSLTGALPRALDVGCGTGLSTVALQEIAGKVVGVDASPEMLAHAPRRAGLNFCMASAEKLPFSEGKFDFITLSQVFHWLDREKFFAEARRVLRRRGWLVVYDNYFSDRMDENEEFRDWFREFYLKKYPSPHRPWASFTTEETLEEGFELISQEMHENTQNFSLTALVDYLMTHSNVIAAVEGGDEAAEAVRASLIERIEPYFAGRDEAGFLFKAPIWIMQRSA
ncbi:MAG: methyltransferase domain-containing protein [Pyrinomonadaceae bacterium]|nr:methyltransferase domain-containing protein [Pyrinomonadaceae bacterium]